MNIARSFAVTKRVLRDLKNDRRTLAIIFVAPILIMCIFGAAFAGDVKDVKVIVVNHDKGTPSGSLSDKVIANFNKDILNVEYSSNESDARAQVQSGDGYAVIVFPDQFTQSVSAKALGKTSVSQEDVTVRVLADKSNVNVANAIIASVNGALAKTMQDMGRKQLFSLDASEAIYGANVQFIDYFVPGIISVAVWQLTTLLTLISFVGERSSGSLFRLLASPIRESELVSGYATAFGALGIMQSAVLLAVGVLLFHITIIGNIVIAFAVIALLAIVSQALGILLSSLAEREAQAIQFLPLVVLPTFLLSGIFWPIESIPVWLRPVSYIFPPTYAVEAMRAVILRGWGLDKIFPDIVALLVFALVFLVTAAILLRRRE
ncbi:MAG TPA: ABC transporter permease [Candidatus Acidoferrales bacterium]|nr:ABC transporter permease [Candidatus Acidoferrales bacterium]